jgi:predicted GNAT superfamily acetyltransferase
MILKNKTWFTLRILETPDDMNAVEDLQRLVWPGSETDVIPLHMLVTFAHNGGMVIGAFTGEQAIPGEIGSGAGSPEDHNRLIGFVFGFPGLYFTPDGPRPKHCSHELGVHPDFRHLGVGFALKRAQWQMVRHQGLDLITWTYDPLLSRNAYLNITRLGGVCSTYQREVYGEMRDGLNAGLPSDRFQVDWWVNSQRVQRRLSRRARPPLDLAHFLSAGAEIINPTQPGSQGYAIPARQKLVTQGKNSAAERSNALLLVEIPYDFQSLRAADAGLALEWRLHARDLFEDLFSQGYLAVDFVHLPGAQSRSFYLLSHGDNTL